MVFENKSARSWTYRIKKNTFCGNHFTWELSFREWSLIVMWRWHCKEKELCKIMPEWLAGVWTRDCPTILNSTENKLLSYGLLVGFIKVINYIDHSIHFHKLNRLEDSRLLEFTKPHIQDRRPLVRQTISGSKKDILSRISQGSIVGPLALIFIIRMSWIMHDKICILRRRHQHISDITFFQWAHYHVKWSASQS